MFDEISGIQKQLEAASIALDAVEKRIHDEGQEQAVASGGISGHVKMVRGWLARSFENLHVGETDVTKIHAALKTSIQELQKRNEVLFSSIMGKSAEALAASPDRAQTPTPNLTLGTGSPRMLHKK